MHTVAERVDYVGFLEEVPSLSKCTKDVLEEFVAHGVVKAHCSAGHLVCGLHEDHNLYVLVSGSAKLHVGQDIVIDLEPGDYFGQDSIRHHQMAGIVVAETDVEVVVVGPQDLAQLELASSQDRHPSRIEWRLERSSVLQRRRRNRRRTVMNAVNV